MNKTELIAAIAEKAELSKKDAEAALNAMVESVTEALVQGDKIQLIGFGSFEVKERAARSGINPRTKEKVRIAETCVPDMREFNCAILHTPYGYRVSAVEEVTRGKDILDYEDKYMGGDGKGIISTKRVWLKEEPLVHQVQQLTMRFGKMLGVRGVARVDFLYDPQQEQLYVNEINTIPGSLSCYLWAWEGVEFPQLLDLIIRDGLEAYRERRRRLSSYDTNVLQQADLRGTKK